MTDGTGMSTGGGWIRSAFWIGEPRDAAAFRAAINDVLVPQLRAAPGVAASQALWPETFEDGAPPIYCQVLNHFRSADDMALMLASPERARMREGVLALLGTFNGTLSHIDYRVS